MFFSYLLYAAVGAVAAAAVVEVAMIALSFTVWAVLTVYNLASKIREHNTNGATRAEVSSVTSAINGAKVVEVGLFSGSQKVGSHTIRCENGTTLHRGEVVYL